MIQSGHVRGGNVRRITDYYVSPQTLVAGGDG